MKPEILLLEPMMPAIEAKLEAAYVVHRPKAPDDAGFIARVAPNVRAIVTGGATGVSNAVADALPKLEIIAINGVGTDAVDLVRARERGVRVTNTPDVLTDKKGEANVQISQIPDVHGHHARSSAVRQ